ncbi:hypothetical protein [Sphingomonas sp.]|uniref:hypothetical protein n=1 Tax=Sphingomonas sp. TaxID=28214 RepID=UPI001ED28B46|nr:hypothetical protein [Sphingomonas sp.]MBX3594479.1 hypothetical protein [Sphingomonas sp.]
MTPAERIMMRHFLEERGRLYAVIAEKAGVSYALVRTFGRKLQNARLAHISVIPFDGCRLFLNARGVRVKRAVEILDRIERNRAQGPSLSQR